MNEKHMQYILAVLKEGSFTAAARKLYISQPSLSQAIKAAETSLGAAIFDRSTDPVSLTPAGRLYVEAADQISSISSRISKPLSFRPFSVSGRPPSLPGQARLFS